MTLDTQKLLEDSFLLPSSKALQKFVQISYKLEGTKIMALQVDAFSTTHAIQWSALVPILILCQALIRSSEYHNNKQDPALGSIYVCAKE